MEYKNAINSLMEASVAENARKEKEAQEQKIFKEQALESLRKRQEQEAAQAAQAQITKTKKKETEGEDSDEVRIG